MGLFFFWNILYSLDQLPATLVELLLWISCLSARATLWISCSWMKAADDTSLPISPYIHSINYWFQCKQKKKKFWWFSFLSFALWMNSELLIIQYNTIQLAITTHNVQSQWLSIIFPINASLSLLCLSYNFWTGGFNASSGKKSRLRAKSICNVESLALCLTYLDCPPKSNTCTPNDSSLIYVRDRFEQTISKKELAYLHVEGSLWVAQNLNLIEVTHPLPHLSVKKEELVTSQSLNITHRILANGRTPFVAKAMTN